MSYDALGRHAEALDTYKQALAFQRRVLPADHPDTAMASLVLLRLRRNLLSFGLPTKRCKFFGLSTQPRIPM